MKAPLGELVFKSKREDAIYSVIIYTKNVVNLVQTLKQAKLPQVFWPPEG